MSRPDWVTELPMYARWIWEWATRVGLRPPDSSTLISMDTTISQGINQLTETHQTREPASENETLGPLNGPRGPIELWDLPEPDSDPSNIRTAIELEFLLATTERLGSAAIPPEYRPIEETQSWMDRPLPEWIRARVMELVEFENSELSANGFEMPALLPSEVELVKKLVETDPYLL